MKKVYIQLSTHWDREWYNPFQAFRYELIGVTDKIISEVKSKQNIENFVFDGQTIVTEDYLDIVPENRCELATQIENGSIKIGPWYVMPDEWLVSGESLIRNFQQGKRICDDFNTEPFRYGYINDIFGHIAQFPQLLNKLGIKMAYLGRGMGADENTFRNFVWKAPDGSKCFGYKNNYSDAYRKYLRFISAGDKSESEKDEYVKNYIESEFEKSGCGVILLNVTDDHANLSDEMLDFVARVKKLDGIELIFDGFDKAYDDIAAAEKNLPEFCGELIQTAQSGDMRVVTDSISSYYPLKEYNDSCQALLENEISPVTVYGNFAGVPIRKEFLRAAYKELLKTHPHDNICGCSADQVHKDMYYRFDQVREIADAVKRDFTYKIGRTVYKKGRNYLLEIFNPAPYKRKQVITVDIDFDKDYPSRFAGHAPYQPRNMFWIFDKDNNCIDYQILNIERDRITNKQNISQDKPCVDRYTVTFEAELTELGMTEFKVVPAKGVVRNENGMQSGDNWAENAYVRLEIMQDGTLSLFDKLTGKKYEKLNYFLDDSEAGNGWFHENAANSDPVITSRFSDCRLEKLASGSVETVFRITKTMLLPECMDYAAYNRSERLKDFKIVSQITLRRDSGNVYIETAIDNNVKDHRLKLMLPTNIKGDKYVAAQAFYFAERNVGADPERRKWYEQEQYEKHFDNIIYKTDENGAGLAFVGAGGFHQAGVLEDKDSTISVIMFRSHGRVHMVNSPTECQLQGPLNFKYALVPMNGKTAKTELLNIRKYGFRKEISVFTRCGDDVSVNSNQGIMNVDGDVCVSIVKPAEKGDGIILRVFNTENTESRFTVTFQRKVNAVSETDLYENITAVIEKNTAKAEIALKPYEIKTLLIDFGEET